MRIAIIGCGNMGSALAQLLSSSHELFLYDHNREKVHFLEEKGYGKSCNNVKEIALHADLILLAVKPQNLNQVAHEISKGIKPHQLVVSILAGTPLSTLRHHFESAHIVRMMPNLALICGEGVIGLVHDEKTSSEEKKALSSAFEALGKVYWMAEDKMDAFSSLTSSGPAFFLVMIEAMIDAAIEMGFSPKDAKTLLYQMMRGSITLLEKTDKHPAELKWQITSPSGMTIAGLKCLEDKGVRSGIIHTFLAAYERALALSSSWETRT